MIYESKTRRYLIIILIAIVLMVWIPVGFVLSSITLLIEKATHKNNLDPGFWMLNFLFRRKS